jgi:hypothetical protein
VTTLLCGQPVHAGVGLVLLLTGNAAAAGCGPAPNSDPPRCFGCPPPDPPDAGRTLAAVAEAMADELGPLLGMAW